MVPPSLTGKYQLAVFEAGSTSGVNTDRLISAVRGALELLNINHRKFLIPIEPGTPSLVIDPRMPSVAVFFGSVPNPALCDSDAARLDRLLADGNLIIPVVDDLARFRDLVPVSIAHLNGLRLLECGAYFERAAVRQR